MLNVKSELNLDMFVREQTPNECLVKWVCCVRITGHSQAFWIVLAKKGVHVNAALC